MRKLEKNSPSWPELRARYENSTISIRALARDGGVSEKTVRNRIKDERWLRGAEKNPRSAPGAEPSADPLDNDPGEIARRACSTIAVLQAQLDVAVRSVDLLREIAEIELDEAGDDKAAARRRKLINDVLSLPSLVMTAERLTAAIARLADAGPGKKDRAAHTAKEVGRAGRFATPAAPGAGSDRLQ